MGASPSWETTSAISSRFFKGTASVFHGFCGIHENYFNQTLENGNFSPAKKGACDVLASRTLFRECHELDARQSIAQPNAANNIMLDGSDANILAMSKIMTARDGTGYVKFDHLIYIMSGHQAWNYVAGVVKYVGEPLIINTIAGYDGVPYVVFSSRNHNRLKTIHHRIMESPNPSTKMLEYCLNFPFYNNVYFNAEWCKQKIKELETLFCNGVMDEDIVDWHIENSMFYVNDDDKLNIPVPKPTEFQDCKRGFSMSFVPSPRSPPAQ